MIANWNDHFHCEIPNNDAHRVFTSIRQMLQFVKDNDGGDLVYDDEFSVWRVPAWADGRKEYSDMVARECARWGCE